MTSERYKKLLVSRWKSGYTCVLLSHDHCPLKWLTTPIWNGLQHEKPSDIRWTSKIISSRKNGNPSGPLLKNTIRSKHALFATDKNVLRFWKRLHYSQYRTETSLGFSSPILGYQNLQLFACSFLSFHTSLIDISDGRWTTLCRSTTIVNCITVKYLIRNLQEDLY